MNLDILVLGVCFAASCYKVRATQLSAVHWTTEQQPNYETQIGKQLQLKSRGACAVECTATFGCWSFDFDENSDSCSLSPATPSWFSAANRSGRVCREDLGYTLLPRDKCLKVNLTTTLNNMDVRSKCISEGGNLALVSNEGEFNAIKMFLDSMGPEAQSNYWIQGDDVGHDNTFTDDAGNSLTFFEWGPGEPDAGWQDYLGLWWVDDAWKHGGWTGDVSGSLRSLCQMTAT